MKDMRHMRTKTPVNGDHQEEGLRALCQHLKDTGNSMHAVVEIGTFIGESAAIFSDYFKEVYTVEPWNMDFVAESVAEDAALTIEDIKEHYAFNTAGKNNITMLRMPSSLASLLFVSRSVDLVYIDGWHNIFAVMVDILSWLPKVKLGGYIGGHDYTLEHNSQVIDAVRVTLSHPDLLFIDTSWLKKVLV